MLRILIAVFLLLVPDYGNAFQLIRPRAAGGTTVYYGAAVDGSGNYSGSALTTSYGSYASDKLYCSFGVSAAAGVADAIRAFHYAGTWTTVYGILYVNGTKVGRTGNISSTSAGSWSAYSTLTVESGQSLSYGAGDTLDICIGYESTGVANDGTMSTLATMRSGFTGIHLNVADWTAGEPPASPTFTTSGTNGLAVILRATE